MAVYAPLGTIPAFVRGTKQEVSTFLLNNHERSFTGDGATIHYACYAHLPLKTQQRNYSPQLNSLLNTFH